MHAHDLRKAAHASAPKIRTSRKTIRHLQIFLAVIALLIPPLFFGPSLAATPYDATLQSTGTILLASANLAVIPDNWSLTYGSGPQLIHLDYNVTHNGYVSIRLDPHTSADVDTTRECDGTWYTVKPGDHIVVKVWIETSQSSLGDTDYRHGGRIGIDFYAHTSVGYGILASADEVTGETDRGIPGQDCVLNWNNPTWTQKGWNLVIPATQYTQVMRGGVMQNCDPVQIDSLVLWLDVRPINDQGQAWFADAELYINPI